MEAPQRQFNYLSDFVDSLRFIRIPNFRLDFAAFKSFGFKWIAFLLWLLDICIGVSSKKANEAPSRIANLFKKSKSIRFSPLVFRQKDGGVFGEHCSWIGPVEARADLLRENIVHLNSWAGSFWLCRAFLMLRPEWRSLAKCSNKLGLPSWELSTRERIAAPIGYRHCRFNKGFFLT